MKETRDEDGRLQHVELEINPREFVLTVDGREWKNIVCLSIDFSYLPIEVYGPESAYLTVGIRCKSLKVGKQSITIETI